MDRRRVSPTRLAFSESIGVELILAGAIFYMKDDVVTIINEILAKMKAQPDWEVFEVDGQGSFTLREVHSSWAQELSLIDVVLHPIPRNQGLHLAAADDG